MPEIKIPYKGTIRDIYDRIKEVFPNPYKDYTMYRSENYLYLMVKGNFIHVVIFEQCEKNFRKCLGFVEYKLKTNGNLELVYPLWGKPVKEFKEDFPVKSDAEKFIEDAYRTLEGLNPYKDDISGILDNLYQKYI